MATVIFLNLVLLGIEVCGVHGFREYGLGRFAECQKCHSRGLEGDSGGERSQPNRLDVEGVSTGTCHLVFLESSKLFCHQMSVSHHCG